MRFLQSPLFFAWAPLILVPIVLYLFRPRPRTVRTSTLPFFKWLAREHQDSAWLRKLKHLLSLLLSILVVLAAAAALGRLVIAPSAESLQTVVILLNRSASMAARNEEGVSRLQEARRLIESRLAGLSAGVGVVVIAYDKRPEVLLSRSMDRRQVARAVEQVKVRPIAGSPADALRLARQLAELETPASIWHATDAPLKEEQLKENPRGENQPPAEQNRDTSEDLPADASGPEPAASTPDKPADQAPQVSVEHLSVALKDPVNVGITAFHLRRLPLERARFNAFVQIHCVGPEKVTANLDIEIDGNLVAPRKLTLEPGGREKLLIPVDAQQDRGRVLSLRLSADGDALDLDNVVHARIPPLQPVRVLWICESPDPFTELALSTLGVDGDLDLLQGPPSAWPPKEPAQVAIFDGWLPPQWPTNIPVVVINPPGSLGPVRAAPIGEKGLPLTNLRSPGSEHPVLFGVATERVAVTQTAVLEADGPLESLWVGAQGPVLLAGKVRDQRVVVLGFSPQHSEQLPLMASYPLLVGNALYWAAESDIDAAQGMNRRTGEIIELAGETLTWETPGTEPSEATTVPLVGSSHELDRQGLWKTEHEGEIGSAALVSTYASNIPARGDEDAESADAGRGAGLFRGDMVPLLLWLVLLILLGESWLYHRSITY